MQVYTRENGYIVAIEMDRDEAEMLKAYIQNPIDNSEDEKTRQLRAKIWNALDAENISLP